MLSQIIQGSPALTFVIDDKHIITHWNNDGGFALAKRQHNGGKHIIKKDPFFGSIKFPLSGDVTQAINPWSWWLKSMGQFGFIYINQMESSDSELERTILENVAGYGKQLGRIVEALNVLVEYSDGTGLTEEDRKVLKDFSDMAAEIAAVKGGYEAPT